MSTRRTRTGFSSSTPKAALRPVRTLAAAVAAVVMTFSAGCGHSEDSGGASGLEQQMLTREEADRDYFDEATRWKLPSGWEWPAGPVYSGVGPDGAAAAYGLDIGKVDATAYWFCAWSRELMEADTRAARSDALVQLRRLPETAFYLIGLSPRGREIYDATLAAAEQGETGDLAERTELNCPTKPQ